MFQVRVASNTQTILCIMTLCNFPPLVRPKIIANAQKDGLSICQCHLRINGSKHFVSVQFNKNYFHLWRRHQPQQEC